MPEPARQQLAAVEPFEHVVSQTHRVQEATESTRARAEKSASSGRRIDQPRSATHSVRSRPIWRPSRADDGAAQGFTGRAVQRSVKA